MQEEEMMANSRALECIDEGDRGRGDLDAWC